MLRVAYFKLDLFGVRGKCLKACYMALADISMGLSCLLLVLVRCKGAST